MNKSTNEGGLLCGIYADKSLPNCSNNGISEKHKSVILIGEGVPVIFSPSKDTPAVKLVRRNIMGSPYIHAEPLDNPREMGWMFGGCYIMTSDSRFPSNYPIPLHDRQETQKEYDQLSQ